MRQFFVGCLLGLVVTSAGARWQPQTLAQQKKEAVRRLKARKNGFEAYLKKQEQWNKKRLSVAYKQKEIRRRYQQKKEKARRSYVRTNQEFPRQAYREFLKKRKQRRGSLEKARQDYQAVQKQLRRVFQNKQYRIDGNKEFKL